ncbi:MAG: GNAT family N-acetyltransferase [Dehalococcoidia bacterium]
MSLYHPPRPLDPGDEVDRFECRSAEQTDWLRHYARQAHASGTAKVLVVTEADSAEVVAYYAWTMASIAIDDAPARMRQGAGRYPQPVALLARLGVSTAHEGRGLGAALLADVISRTAELGAEIGCRGLLVPAETPEARAFYLHLIPEFERSPTDELHLMVLMKDILKTLAE